MTPIDTKLYNLLAAMVNGEVLILANQNAPRPALPYWTYYVTPRRHIGVDGYSQGVDDNGDQEVYGVREATVMVQRIGADSDMHVQDLRDNLAKITVQNAWQVQGVAAFNTSDVMSVPYKMDDDHLEPRATVDLFVRFGTKLIDNVGIIETVTTTPNYP